MLSLCRLTPEDKRLLWEKKAFCQSESAALPLVLASAPCWQWACLPDIYALLRQWACLGHLDALGLLHASYVYCDIQTMVQCDEMFLMTAPKNDEK